MAFTHVHITLQHLGLTDDHAILFDRLASRVFGSDASCISPDDLARNTLGQSNLWGYGISGDLPIVLVRVTEVAGLPLVRQLLHAQEYWRVKGLRADVVILNEHPADYLDEMQQLLIGLVAGAALGGLEGQAGRHVPAARRRHARGRPPSALGRRARRRCAAIWASWRRSSIARRPGCIPSRTVPPSAELAAARSRRPRRCRSRRSSWRTASAASRPTAANTSSCSTAIARRRCRGRTCWRTPSSARWSARPGRRSPGPENSRENRLTPFANDPVCRSDRRSDLPARRGLAARSGAPRRARCRAGPTAGRWVVRHAAGVTRYQHATAGLEQELAVFVAPDDPVKLAVLTLTNTSTVGAASERVRLRRVVPGSAARRRAAVRRDRDATRRPARSVARNAYNTEFSDRVALLARHREPRARTRATAPSSSAATARSTGRRRCFASALAGRSGAGLDPCAALQVALEIRAGRDAPRRVRARPGTRRCARRRRSPPATHRSPHVDAALRARRTLLGRDARRRPGAARPTIPST